jgi:methionyl-tRNA synthetase
LANDLGNLLSRILNMAAKTLGEIPAEYRDDGAFSIKIEQADKNYRAAMDILAFDKALDAVWRVISDMNKYIDETKPWTLAKAQPEKAKSILLELIFALKKVNIWIEPFMPSIAGEMKNRLKAGPIGKYAPLFPRIEE